jgi:hypothetical protein
LVGAYNLIDITILTVIDLILMNFCEIVSEGTMTLKRGEG